MNTAKRFVVWGVLVLILLAMISCGSSEPETKTGKITGVRVNFSLDDMADGVIEDMNFWGVVIVELEDGSKVDAAVDEELAKTLKGGDVVVIQATDDPEMWKVLRLASSSSK